MSTTSPPCGETSLNPSGLPRTCERETGHDGDHMDAHGARWEPPRVVLERFRERWGRSHRIVWTGRLWVATAHDSRASWRTEIEYTPDQLEERLRKRGVPPVFPAKEERG
ncbi:hypothetical protein [Nocardiopsis sp. LOL_012]|uniref:hypothetical protein n=1 Tax=Nocardiopsis sp. LOL_012 TaxID=3345409 RepID=UPI003A8941AE